MRRRRPLLALFAAATMVAALAPAATAADPTTYTATPLSPLERVEAFKSASSALVQSDQKLLARTDSRLVPIIVKLDYDAIASYAGGLKGLPATSPRITGQALDGKSSAQVRYERHVEAKETSFIKALKARVPSARVGASLRYVYGGVALRVPADQAKRILGIDGVVAVQADHLNKPLTDTSADFIDASKTYFGLGGTADAGSGVIFGSIDSGVWPEHPSLADKGNLAAPPPKTDGTPRACDFGDNPLTPATDVFACNHKLIGGAPFIDTYNDLQGGETYPDTARDSNGHGTHTATTAAGDIVTDVPVLGVQRGPIHGIAPGAWVSAYKVCGALGCYDSDTSAAVQQAILDGVDVINYSISGGTDPLNDATELAFLDAYAAGIFVAASSGNEGPGAGTANHLSPWVMTVAASTQKREFASTLTLTSTDGSRLVLTGASLTAGVSPAKPVVLSSAAPYSDDLCEAPAAPGTFTGKIVACKRGVNARVDKGYNVAQGGAAGMILYNPSLADVETDNHWLPTVHLANGASFVAFMGAHPGVTATFTAGTKRNGTGDVMAAFSSRGPAGNFIKPDITAPGVEILAGHTPTPESITEGPAGQYFQAIAGTSMSSPEVAGSAILVRALNPGWSPGQVKSALMTTANTKVVKEDLKTPADPFDFGAGRVDVDNAGAAMLTFDETAARYFALSGDALHAIDLNVPSINAPVMPGRITTTRTVRNVTRGVVEFDLSTVSPKNSKITVSPKHLKINPNRTATFTVTISSEAKIGKQLFGQVVLKQTVKKGRPAQQLHLPVAFIHRQGDVAVSQSCLPGKVSVGTTTDCTVVATNLGMEPQTVSFKSITDKPLNIRSATGATRVDKHLARKSSVTLAPAVAGVPSIGAGATPAGYLPLELFGVGSTPIGDEDFLNYNVPAFLYNGVTYNQLGVSSNGYVKAGLATAEDNNCCNLPTGPDPAAPNDMIAPFWTDLDGSAAEGIKIGVLADGPTAWIVIEWHVNVWGTLSERTFQVWIGINDVQDISIAYDPAHLPAAPTGQDYLTGAENANGDGEFLPAGDLPTEDLVVTSTDPTPGGSVTYGLELKGKKKGTGVLRTSMTASGVAGTTVVETFIKVKKK